jgi:hypothetical protein
MLNETEAMTTLLASGAKIGSLLFVSYSAGRVPTDRAYREGARAQRQGIARRHFTGELTSVWKNKKGEFCFTVKTPERDDERTGQQEAWRTFNPSIGELHSLEVLA